jgi:hypothetical protein
MNSLAASLFFVNRGIAQPHPPAYVFDPPGPAGGTVMETFSGEYHCVFAFATSQKNVHSRIVSS